MDERLALINNRWDSMTQADRQEIADRVAVWLREQPPEIQQKCRENVRALPRQTIKSPIGRKGTQGRMVTPKTATRNRPAHPPTPKPPTKSTKLP